MSEEGLKKASSLEGLNSNSADGQSQTARHNSESKVDELNDASFLSRIQAEEKAARDLLLNVPEDFKLVRRESDLTDPSLKPKLPASKQESADEQESDYSGPFAHLVEHVNRVQALQFTDFRQFVWALLYSQPFDATDRTKAAFLWLSTVAPETIDFSTPTKDYTPPHSREEPRYGRTSTIWETPEASLLAFKKGTRAYAQVLQLLLAYAGPEVNALLVIGIVRVKREESDDRRHSWNLVKLGDSWFFADALWASGREIKKEPKRVEGLLDLYYFGVPPAQFVYTHLPEEEHYQLLETPVTAQEFEKFPQIGRGFFSRFGLRMLTHFKSPIKIKNETGIEEIKLSYPKRLTDRIHFSQKLVFKNGDDALPDSQTKLTAFARNALADKEVSFHLRLPQKGFYKFAIFARDRLTSPKHEHSHLTEGVFQYSFEKVIEYNVQYLGETDGDEEVQTGPVVPFPPTVQQRYGRYEAGRELKLTCEQSAKLRTSNGVVEVTLKLPDGKAARAQARLKTSLGGLEERLLECAAIARYDAGAGALRITAFTPLRGEYALELLGGELTADTPATASIVALWTFLLTSDSEAPAAALVCSAPKQPLLGPQPRALALGLTPVSHTDPFFEVELDSSREITVEFAIKEPLRIKAALVAAGPGESLVEHPFNVLQNMIPAEKKASFRVRFPSVGGFFKLTFSGTLATDPATTPLQMLFSYLILTKEKEGSGSAKATAPAVFPKQTASWYDGGRLHSPLDATSIKSNEQVQFRVEVPNAQKVAVTVGGKWTQLAKDAADAAGLTWTGVVNAASAAAGDKVQLNGAIDASPPSSGGFFGFGSPPAPTFKQLLEYTLE